MNYIILDEVKMLVTKLRKKRMRLRAIFQRFRKLKKFEDWSDLTLLNSLVIALRELEFPYSLREVYSAFKLVDKNDYQKGIKKELLRFLTDGSQHNSVFNINKPIK